MYRTYKEIDKKKWDKCVLHAVNSLLYGQSFYLDAMADNWDGIVLNDYEAVMPLTWKQKWSIRYLYQPAFIQQGGIFFTKTLSPDQTNAFIDIAFQQFKFAEITLNFANEIKNIPEKTQISQRNNFILDLNRSYDQLYDNYDPSFTKSLRRIRKFEMNYTETDNYVDIILLYKKLYGDRLPFFTSKNYLSFEKVCKKLSAEKKLIARMAKGKNDQLLAAVILLKDNNRFYNIISCITDEGKRLEANYFLYDRILHEFAGNPCLFDFEGSDVKGIATFYKKFNPENQSYPYIKHNNLPKLVKLFKA